MSSSKSDTEVYVVDGAGTITIEPPPLLLSTAELTLRRSAMQPRKRRRSRGLAVAGLSLSALLATQYDAPTPTHAAWSDFAITTQSAGAGVWGDDEGSCEKDVPVGRYRLGPPDCVVADPQRANDTHPVPGSKRDKGRDPSANEDLQTSSENAPGASDAGDEKPVTTEPIQAKLPAVETGETLFTATLTEIRVAENAPPPASTPDTDASAQPTMAPEAVAALPDDAPEAEEQPVVDSGPTDADDRTPSIDTAPTGSAEPAPAPAASGEETAAGHDVPLPPPPTEPSPASVDAPGPTPLPEPATESAPESAEAPEPTPPPPPDPTTMPADTRSSSEAESGAVVLAAGDDIQHLPEINGLGASDVAMLECWDGESWVAIMPIAEKEPDGATVSATTVESLIVACPSLFRVVVEPGGGMSAGTDGEQLVIDAADAAATQAPTTPAEAPVDVTPEEEASAAETSDTANSLSASPELQP